MPVAPPRPKDLPLNALRAFEAAARLQGFAAAAMELGVTPGAVTAHVKALEDRLGAPLFDRTARGVHLTQLGATVLPAFTAAFDALGQAQHQLRAEAAPRSVHIATLPAIAQLWLSPRLPALRAAMPEIALSVTAMEAPPNLKRAPYDLSLFPGTEGRVIAEDEIFPVCAPSLAARIHRPEDLAQFPCLIDSAWSADWPLWLEAALPCTAFTPRGPVFSLYALAVEEAAGGAGVLMGHAPLVAAHLARGALVAPLPQRVRLAKSIRLWSARPLRPGQPADRVARALAEPQGWPV
ncbi:LysR family transcriptional regulator [Neotabrizicola shimadae]|uniref:LysR family transcriptional regulator n=1 Tax=Neotabrizicola shimadae TaxID=2807096 RepID=A0A8G0ZTP1_9RHOB|nr:LysR family transcriptional regulator [Neotabrizicola shimadae]QYZ68721.1 LysR family transcriptional regulator [Neotabrizicola shimadae]